MNDRAFRQQTRNTPHRSTKTSVRVCVCVRIRVRRPVSIRNDRGPRERSKRKRGLKIKRTWPASDTRVTRGAERGTWWPRWRTGNDPVPVACDRQKNRRKSTDRDGRPPPFYVCASNDVRTFHGLGPGWEGRRRRFVNMVLP